MASTTATINVTLTPDEASVVQYALANLFGHRKHPHLPLEAPIVSPLAEDAQAIHEKLAALGAVTATFDEQRAAYIAGLRAEREQYEAKHDPEGIAAVDAELARVESEAKPGGQAVS